MLIAVGLTALGLLAVAAATQLFGYRLGGTISVPVLAVYALKDAVTLPVSVLSAIIAYIGLALLRQRTLIYGRDELLAAIALGSAIPLGVFLFFEVVGGPPVDAVLFLGSILPGLAAYNYHQLDPEQRRGDLLATVLLLVVLVGFGALVVSPRTADLVTGLPPTLFGPTADIAVLRDAVVAGPLQPVVLRRELVLGVFGGALVLSEAVRKRYAVRIGVLGVGLLAVYALASVWLLVLYLVLYVAGYLLLAVVHRLTLLYGRVLIGVTGAGTLLVAVPVVAALPVVRGLSAYFVAVIAAINAYNTHATTARYRVLVPVLQVSVFVPLYVVGRLLAPPLEGGLAVAATPLSLSLAILLVLAGMVLAKAFVVDRPAADRVRRDSILPGRETE